MKSYTSHFKRAVFDVWYEQLRTESPIFEREIRELAYRLYLAGRTDATNEVLAIMDSRIERITNDLINEGAN